ncbi:N,N'-diacetylchitobiose-specific phosphotransferase enzyme IIA component [Listeria grayi]|uniref:PTS system, lactose-specific IIa component n=3 Tax=Listeria grayi TaxID=1641 RepID=D7UVB2_LISGR|nr:PTS lactose/cellobiose transporter subunit IIA [Listeria grayi]EFI85188.1 PTS system, lactose-specific IIa component [Listeria grayi DSM 20601]EUJ28728.1 Lichenan-specific phosphotransferase enzyme IIA component [Listeria grayi FSL F6-1183]MBC1922960.1 PTS lactose/cellobiose transporter subunit IIA [Listeria grayi]STY44588.1 N,N'-diacetylchitobiose-specific phosphotransferase enzyme IIA component [Listeria grayi]VEI36715.1 N,N'-diacetylchitobiose-specific phosphotransferase enzyme IIA compo
MNTELEQTIMSLIVFGGNAKSDAMLAIEAAKKGDFEQADAGIAQAEASLLEAHHSQTKLIQGEARGERTEVSLLLVHAQDHLMNAITFKDLAKEIVDLYRSK